MTTAAHVIEGTRPARIPEWRRFIPDLRLGLDNLLLHKLRSLLTMLGMIFGVAAVVSMLSIGAGAQQKVMAFIEQLGVRNLIIEAKESTDYDTHNKIRRTSPGLTFQDYRVIQANLGGIVASTPRKRFIPSKVFPKPQMDLPVLFGVEPSYVRIAGLRAVDGRFFDAEENREARPICVLGEGAKASLFGPTAAVGQYVKVDEQWLHVVGVVGPQLSPGADVAGLSAQDLNNLIYVPLLTAINRLEDNKSELHDEIDGIYLRMADAALIPGSAELVRGILNASHRGAPDFSVIVPAELLAEQRRTERLFNIVMVAIASISLLVGGIGIMNIMLVSVTERTREIGVRMAVGATEQDVRMQFLSEALVLSLLGGSVGVLVGVAGSVAVSSMLEWPTRIPPDSVALAVLFSAAVGVFFGYYPAHKAAHLDPIEALRYE